MQNELVLAVALLLVVAVVGILIYVMGRETTGRRTSQDRGLGGWSGGPESVKEPDKVLRDMGISIQVTQASPHARTSSQAKPPAKTADGGWLLNPGATFPLTLHGIDEQAVSNLWAALQSGQSKGWYGIEKDLVPIIAKTNLRCKELDDYVREFGPKYFQRIEELKRQHAAEWDSAGDKDKEDMLTNFREQALAGLEVRPDCDLQTLFECEPKDSAIDDALIHRFGYENITVYLRYTQRLADILKIPADSPHRANFEQLADHGLVRRGNDIPMEDLLPGLTLKEMASVVSDLNPPKFARKAKAIEFLNSLPDLRARLQRQIAFRELFQLRPLPSDLAHISLEEVSRTWRHAEQVAALLLRTYVASEQLSQRYGEFDDESLSFVRGWDISAYDPCPFCRRLAGKRYAPKSPPQVPFHIGCRCVAIAKYGE